MEETYTITKETIESVLEALEMHCFSEDGEYNNDEVFDAIDDLKGEINKQGR